MALAHSTDPMERRAEGVLLFLGLSHTVSELTPRVFVERVRGVVVEEIEAKTTGMPVKPNCSATTALCQHSELLDRILRYIRADEDLTLSATKFFFSQKPANLPITRLAVMTFTIAIQAFLDDTTPANTYAHRS